MEITIDEVIKALKWFLEYNEEDYYVGDRFQDKYGDWFYKVSERDFKAFRRAVDIMRKYQIIQKVLEKVWNTPSCMLDEAECLNEIMETYRTVR